MMPDLAPRRRPLAWLYVLAVVLLMVRIAAQRIPDQSARMLVQAVVSGQLCSVLCISVVAVLLVEWLSRAGWLHRTLAAAGLPREGDGGPETTAPSAGNALWLLLGLILTLAVIVFLEHLQPFYFTQDDAYVGCPPGMQACASLLYHGVFPTWNPYQLMGQPTSCQSYSMLTYPPLYLAYFLASSVLHNPYTYNDIFCIMHVILAYLAVFCAARYLGLRPALAMTAGLAAALSGCNLIMGRGYSIMTPVMVYMPLLIIAVERLRRARVGWRWTLLTGLVLGLGCNAGDGQMWVYAVCFCGLAMLAMMWAGCMRGRRALQALPALLIGVAIGAPLIVAQMDLAAGLPRNQAQGYGHGIIRGLLAMVFPYPLTHAANPNAWGSTNLQYMGEFYYSGTLFVVCSALACLAVVGILVGYRCNVRLAKALIGPNPWLVCALVAFVLGCGARGTAWYYLSRLPLFDMFSGPFKQLLFLDLFMALGGGLVLERLLQSSGSRPSWGAWLAAGGAILVVYGACMARPSFYSYGDRPYPPLPAAMAQLLRNPDGYPQRILPIAALRSPLPNYTFSLMHELSAVYGIYSVLGYDPFVQTTPQNVAVTLDILMSPVEACRTYGVRWVIVHRTVDRPVYSPGRHMLTMETVIPPWRHAADRIRTKCPCRLKLPDVSIYEIPDPDPMAFSEANRHDALAIHFSQVGADVNVSRIKAGVPVIVNVAWRRRMVAALDGRPVALQEDRFHRVKVILPDHGQILQLRYRPLWDKGFELGAILLLIACTLAIWLRRSGE